MTMIRWIGVDRDAVASSPYPDFPVGRRYQPVGARWTEWVVRRIVRFPSETRPHVQLQRVGRPRECKSISLDALLDERLYRLVDPDYVPCASPQPLLDRISRLIAGRS